MAKATSPTLNKEQRRHLLSTMLESRHGDLREESLNRQGKGHFHVRIVSAAFAGHAPLTRHRMVYAALEGLMDNGIHALSIDAQSVNINK